MEIDHIGYAVKNIDKSIIEFKKLGYVFENIIIDVKRNINICFGSLDGYRIELVSPYDKNQSSPVDNYIKGNCNTPYHICYKSADLENVISDLQSDGFLLVKEPDKACAFDNKRVAFMFNSKVGIFEIVES